MKELTTAQGLLRCGECNHTFNAMASLSNTLQANSNYDAHKIDSENLTSIGHNSYGKGFQHSMTTAKPYTTAEDNAKKYITLAIVGFACLLLYQVLYSYRDVLIHHPITGGITRSICDVLNCEITPKRMPDKIKIISRNVYAHPNDGDALIISASMRNEAPLDQPYPLIEVSFLDTQGATVALRRFPPKSYLKNLENEGQDNPTTFEDTPKKLFKRNDTLTFRLKIVDPGVKAVRFQFRFI